MPTNDAADVARAAAGRRRIFDLVVAGAARTPAAIALRQDGHVWTYATLHEAALEVAADLAALGVARGDRVIIVADNGLAQVAAFFGAAALGAWPSLLNARSSAREIDAIRDHARPRVILYTLRTSDEAAAHALRHDALQHRGLAGSDDIVVAFGVPDTTAVAESGPARPRV
jgi:acyl-CoA synthetase (AMP-forming)/AMP-acid ligase II